MCNNIETCLSVFFFGKVGRSKGMPLVAGSSSGNYFAKETLYIIRMDSLKVITSSRRPKDWVPMHPKLGCLSS